MNGEHVLAAPVERGSRDDVASIAAPAVRGPDAHAVDERLVVIIDFAELEMSRGCRRGGQREPSAIPGVPVIIRMTGLLPIQRHRDRFPGLLVEVARGVPGIVAGAKPPGSTQTDERGGCRDRRGEPALDVL